MYNFVPYNVLLAIATNIPVLLMTAFVLQGHEYDAGQHALKFKILGQKMLLYEFLSHIS